MAYNHEYPYVDPNRYNSDWILNKIKEIEKVLTEWEAINKITFDGEWDISKNYPAWCIVNTNGGTEGYISIKPVPAGVVITNTDYWVSVVNYTATIADLQNRVVALEADVAALQRKKRRYVLITDSYGMGAVSDDNTSVVSHFLAEMGLTENVDIISYALAAHGFVADGVDTFISMLPTVYQRTQDGTADFDETEVTDLIVVGGDNDWNQTRADIVSAISTFVTAAKGYFPNATVWIGEIGNVTNLSNHIKIGSNVIPAYMDAPDCGALYLNGVEKVMLINSYFMVDGVHPTGEGMKAIACAIKQALLAGEFNMLLGGVYSINPVGNDIGSTENGTNIECRVYNDGRRVRIYLNGSMDVATIPSALSNVKLFDIVDCPIVKGGLVNGQAFGMGWAHFHGGGNTKSVPATFYLLSNALYVVLGDTMTGATELRFSYVSFEIPALTN